MAHLLSKGDFRFGEKAPRGPQKGISGWLTTVSTTKGAEPVSWG